MRHIGKWLAKVLGTALSIVLVFVMLPYASRLAAQFMPDMSGVALTTSATLARELRTSARLETTTVDEKGVITSSTSAFLLGVVQSVAIPYDYHASVGIDLSNVQLSVSGNTITFLLPELEVLSDSLTPDFTQATINDTWYTLTDTRRQQLLDDEQAARRAAALSDESSETAWNNTLEVFEQYIAKWISLGNSHLTYRYERISVAQE